MNSSGSILRLGTRGSLLARAQSEIVAEQLRAIRPQLQIETTVIQTTGDRVTDRPLHEIGGKGVFVKEIEVALLDGKIDLAVHSYKDVPVTMPLVDESNLIIAATPKREDPRDVAVMRDPKHGVLPAGARIGTCSLRRRCQVMLAAPDATMLDLRGNIDTRIQKLRRGDYDVIVLAMAGLVRAKLYDPGFMSPLPILPAAGQGALAVQCRRDDSITRRLISPLNDPRTEQCVAAERSIVETLNGDCHSPIAALATAYNEEEIELSAAVGCRGGVPPVVYATARGKADDVVGNVVDQLRRQGVDDLLRG